MINTRNISNIEISTRSYDKRFKDADVWSVEAYLIDGRTRTIVSDLDSYEQAKEIVDRLAEMLHAEYIGYTRTPSFCVKLKEEKNGR